MLTDPAPPPLPHQWIVHHHSSCPEGSAVEPPGSLCARLWSNPAEWRHRVIAFINSRNATALHSVCCRLHLQQKCRKRRCVGSSGAGKSLRSCSWGPPKAWRHRWGTPATQAKHCEGAGGWGVVPLPRPPLPTTWRESRAC